MAKHNSLSELFTDIADSIRAKTGGTDTIVADNFPEAIEAIEAGSGGIAAGISYDEVMLSGTSWKVVKATVYGSKVLQFALYGQSELTEVNLANDVNIIEQKAFSSCSKLNFEKLPDALTTISGEAFSDCTALSLTLLPDGVRTINGRAFYNCRVLALTKLPNVTSLGNGYEFYECRKLAITEIPATVTSIGSQTFYRCEGLTTLTFKGKPNNISSSSFQNCANLTTINVPWAEGAVANAPWGATKATINYNYTGA